MASPGSDPYLDPVCGPDGVVDDWDVAAVGHAFSGNIPAGCNVLNFDIQRDCLVCLTDGKVDLTDWLASMDV